MGGNSMAALLSEDGWFEVIEDEWIAAAAKVTHSRAWEYRFHADQVSVEDKMIRGEDTSVESHKLDAVSFRGWRKGHADGDMLLFLPPVEQRSDGLVTEATVPEPSEACCTEDPDAVIVGVASKM